jgi:hypothetical protein
LQGLLESFLTKRVGGQPPQRVVDERHELFQGGGGAVAFPPKSQ